MLNLYREHTKNCTRHYRARLHTRKAQESSSLGWKKCGCPVYASGTLKDGFQRKKTSYTTWAEAEAQATKWEQAGSWSGPVPPAASSAPPEPGPGKGSGTTIEEGVKAFLAKCERRAFRSLQTASTKRSPNSFELTVMEKGTSPPASYRGRRRTLLRHMEGRRTGSGSKVGTIPQNGEVLEEAGLDRTRSRSV